MAFGSQAQTARMPAKSVGRLHAEGNKNTKGKSSSNNPRQPLCRAHDDWTGSIDIQPPQDPCVKEGEGGERGERGERETRHVVEPQFAIFRGQSGPPGQVLIPSVLSSACGPSRGSQWRWSGPLLANGSCTDACAVHAAYDAPAGRRVLVIWPARCEVAASIYVQEDSSSAPIYAFC